MKKNKKKGFTLIELVAGLTIFIIVSVTIMSLIMTTFSHNAINKKTFDSNSMSKVFYETLRNNRPGGTPYLTEAPYNTSEGGTYYVAFDDESELTTAITNNILKESVILTSTTDNYQVGRCDKNDDFNNLKTRHGVTDNSYLMKLNIVNNTTEKVYEFTTTIWDISKGEVSSVERKSLISTVS